MKRLPIYVIGFSLLFGCSDGNNKNNDTDEPIESNTIRASIFVEDIPDVLIIDYQETEDRSREYGWSVTFDINDDGIVGVGDIVFRISEDKQAGETEREVEFNDLEAKLLQYEDEDTLYIKGVLDFEVNDNVLTFIVDRDLHEDLKSISLMTQVNVHTYKNIPSAISYDYLPGYAEYTQLQDTSTITDELMDYYGDDSTTDISKFTIEISEP